MSRNTENSPQTLTARFEEFCDRCRAAIAAPLGILAIAFCIIAACLLLNPPADPDLFARVAIGRLISLHGILITDPFGFTPRKPIFVDHEWFAGYLFYFLTRAGGDGAIVLFTLGTLLLSMWYLYKAALVYTPQGRVFFPCFFFGLVQCGYLWGSFVRSQVITYLFLSVLFWGIAVFDRKKNARPLWAFPLMMLIWCNSHGGFVTGLGFVGLYLLVLVARRDGRGVARVATILILMLAATCLNPYGVVTFWNFVLEAISMPRPSISEWGSLSPADWVSWPTYIYFVIILIGMWRYTASIDTLASVLLPVALWQGIAHLRLIAIPAMVAVVFCEAPFEAAVRKLFGFRVTLARAGSFAMTALAVAACLFLVYRVFTFRFPILDYSRYPNTVVNWLRRSGLSGDILVDFNNGSYVLWRLFPKFRVSLDGRYEEVYPEKTVETASEALDPDSARFLESFRAVSPDFALLPSGEKTKKALTLLPPEWRVFAWSEEYTLLGRGAPPIVSDVADGVPDDVWEPLY